MPRRVYIEMDSVPEPPQRAPGVPGAELRRTWLIGQLLTPLCPDCAAQPGESCDYLLLPPTELIRVTKPNEWPPMTVHTARADLAIGMRLVSRAELLGQFAGSRPKLT